MDQWFNLPDGMDALDIPDWRGKVVYLYCFQSWCPGCHSSGFPTLIELIKRYEEKEDVAFIAIQTVFEGFHTNTPGKAKSTAEKYVLTIPVAHSGLEKKRSAIMRDYRTGGSPWTIIIGRNGKVRFNDFHIRPGQAEKLIDQLLREKALSVPPLKPLPPSRGGQELIGKTVKTTPFGRQISPTPRDKPAKRTAKNIHVMLVYCWADSEKNNLKTLAAIEKLRRAHSTGRLRTIALYLPRARDTKSDEMIVKLAAEAGYHGDIVIDEKETMRTQIGRMETKRMTLLVDANNSIRFVHPGPAFFTSPDPNYARENHDHYLVDRAIKALLHEAESRAAQKSSMKEEAN